MPEIPAAQPQYAEVASVFESITDAFLALDENWRFTYVNSRAAQVLFRTREELLGKNVWEEFPYAVGSAIEREYRRAAAEKKAVHFEEFYTPLDAWFEIRAYPANGGLAVYFQDITQRKNAEQALRQSERRYRTLIESLPQLVWTCLPDGNCDYLSSQWVEYTGIAEERQLGLRWLDLVMHPDDRDRTYDAWMKAIAGQAQYDLDYRLRRYDGAYRWFKTRGTPVRDETGAIVQWLGTCTDIDDQIRSAEELARATQEIERQWRIFDSALSNTPDFTYIFDTEGRFTYANRGLLDLLQRTYETTVGKNFFDIGYPPELAATLQMQIRKVVETGQPVRAETPFTSPLGVTRQYEYIFVPVFTPGGAIVRVAGSTRDVTERKAAEQSLRDSEERLRFALQSGRMGSWEYDRVTHEVSRSEEYFRILGFEEPPPDWDYQKFLERVVPEDRAQVNRGFAQMAASGDDVEFEVRIHRLDGETRWIWLRGRRFGDSRGLSRTVGIISDVTERKRIEERLRESAKLESIGVLAGGIAHDFNNLLTGILGNASLATEELGPHHPVHPLIDEVLRAAERASDLTKQMLAYSGRGRFVVRRFDLSATIRDLATLLKASIPRSVTLELQLSDQMAIEADSAQIQQLVMNLIINGAESMGTRQGKVAVSTSACRLTGADILRLKTSFDIAPGNYVCLTVEDDGCGMTESTQAKIFDPFFTTKFTGRGLGLSAVLGILRGHKGALDLKSQPDIGTRFSIYLPASASPADHGDRRLAPAMKGEGTVLVVDDEETVRRTARTMLERSGFSVICAENGEDAAKILLNRADPIDAVLLDMSMPVLSGEKTLPLLLSIRPGTPVVLSSGYSEAEAAKLFGVTKPAVFLQKPYTAPQLVEALLQVKGSQKSRKT